MDLATEIAFDVWPAESPPNDAPSPRIRASAWTEVFCGSPIIVTPKFHRCDYDHIRSLCVDSNAHRVTGSAPKNVEGPSRPAGRANPSTAQYGPQTGSPGPNGSSG